MNKPEKAAKTGVPDYSSTLYLPQTDFPMRAGLPQKEPEILARWERIGLYEKLRQSAAAVRALRAPHSGLQQRRVVPRECVRVHDPRGLRRASIPASATAVGVGRAIGAGLVAKVGRSRGLEPLDLQTR